MHAPSPSPIFCIIPHSLVGDQFGLILLSFVPFFGSILVNFIHVAILGHVGGHLGGHFGPPSQARVAGLRLCCCFGSFPAFHWAISIRLYAWKDCLWLARKKLPKKRPHWNRDLSKFLHALKKHLHLLPKKISIPSFYFCSMVRNTTPIAANPGGGECARDPDSKKSSGNTTKISFSKKT